MNLFYEEKMNQMKSLFTSILLCAALPLMAGNQSGAKTAQPRWLDPSVNEVNREPMRSSFIAYPAGVKAVATAEFSKSPLYRSIGGEWKFLGMQNADDPRPADFYKPGFNDSSWGVMPVPGLWELNGFGDPMYTNIPYPWQNFFRNNPPFVPSERNHVGMYRRTIEVPADWKGNDIFIHIGSATSNVTLWVNGREVGYSEDSKLAAEFNITKFVKPGAGNLFAMEIYRWCDGSYLEDQDFWRLSGIGRDCYIYCRPKARLADVKITPDMVNSHNDGILGVRIETVGAVASVKLTLSDPRGKVLEERTVPVAKNAVFAEFKVADARRWSAENPALYRLEVAAMAAKGTVIEHTAFGVGFRKVEIRDRQLLVNGRPILIKGADRHEMNPYTGYYLTKEDMLKDIEVLKKLNINAVRTSHYPNSPLWYDLCDQYGIYLVDEGNIESHAMGYGDKTLARNPLYYEAHQQRDRRMVLRDYNHPSVIIWSMGNECGNGRNFLDSYDWIKAYDTTRPVQFEQAHESSLGPLGKTMRNTDIVCPMYPTHEWCEEYCASSDNPRPLILCEYAHAMGNSMGGFKEYWDLVRKYPAFQGGFIWDFVDQALAWKDPLSGKLTWRFGGDYNNVDVSDGNFNCNGLVSPSRDIHPCTYEVRYQYQNIWTSDADARDGKIGVRNENFFVCLDNVGMEWEVAVEGRSFLKGAVDKLEVKPQASTVLKLGYSAAGLEALPAGETFLNVRYFLKKDSGILKAGTEIAWAQIPLKAYDWTLKASAAGGKLDVDKAARSVAGEGFSVRFNDFGWLCSYKVKGKEMLSSPVEPQFYRAPTDNDEGVINSGSRVRQSWLDWRDVKWECKFFSLTAAGGVAVAEAEYSSGRLNTDISFRYEIAPDGKVKVLEMMKKGNAKATVLVNMFRFGCGFAMPGEFDTVEFYGEGPWENYIDRRSASSIGLYRQNVAGQFYQQYVETGESGTHSGLRWFALKNAAGEGLLVRSGAEFSASAIDYPMSQIDRYSPDWRQHPSELEPDGLTHVNIDAVQQGAGGIDSWGKMPRPEHRVLYADRKWEFVIEPLGVD